MFWAVHQPMKGTKRSKKTGTRAPESGAALHSQAHKYSLML